MISIIVPVYNVEKYLKQCLDSIAAQKYKDIEIICVNDGSTDSSGAILSEFSDSDSRFKIITQANAGYGEAMNTGLDSASGEFIGIVESDDFIEDDMYEKLLEWITESNADFVKTDYYRYKNGSDVKARICNEAVYDSVFSGINLKPDFLFAGGNIWSGLYRKSFLEKNAIRFLETPGASYQDIGFNFKVFASADRIVFKDSSFYHYRIDNESSSVNSKSKVYCVCDELSDIESYLSDRRELDYITNHWLAPYRFFCYRWNYNRINNEYKPDFLMRWIQETQEDLDKGLIDYNDFLPDMLTQIQDMLENKEELYVNEMCEIKRRECLRRGFFDALKSDQHVYIYGAGNIGSEVYSLLKENNIVPELVLVNNTDDNPDTFNDIKVIKYANAPNKEDSIVLVSLSMKSLYEVLENLSSAGFKQIIPMTRSLIEDLK